MKIEVVRPAPGLDMQADTNRRMRDRLKQERAALEEPTLRAQLIQELSEEFFVHPDFIEGFVQSFESQGSEIIFEATETMEVPRRS